VAEPAPARPANSSKAFEPPPGWAPPAAQAPIAAALPRAPMMEPAATLPATTRLPPSSPVGTVYFANQSAAITGDANAELARVARILTGTRQIELRPYARGSDPVNDRKVALARALAVRRSLIDLGVTSKIEISSYASNRSDGASECVDILGQAAPTEVASTAPVPVKPVDPNRAFEPPAASLPAQASITTAPSRAPVVEPAPIAGAPAGTVRFASRSAEITDEAKAELGRIAKTLKSARFIALRGYAGGGDPDDDRKVALARVLSVRSYLIDLGVKAKIDISTFAHLPSAGATEYVDVVVPGG
jgi:outer membrane protein OmpA-like peptidoglycan-associated protein